MVFSNRGDWGPFCHILGLFFRTFAPFYLIHFSATSLALTHDRVPDSAPLPDILLDSVQYQVTLMQMIMMLLIMTAMQMVMIMIKMLLIMIKMLLIMTL